MESEKEVKEYKWPVIDGCSSVIIRKFAQATDERDGVAPSVQSVVTSMPEIESIFTLMCSLPVEGDMFKSFSDDTDVIHITFVYSLESGASSEDHLYIYGGRVQTPDTTFLSLGNESEKSFIALVEGFLK